MTNVLFMALKDIRLLLRDKFGLFWVLVFPLMMALFFGSIFSSSGSGASKLQVAAVVQSVNENAETLVSKLEESSALSVRRLPLDSARQLVGQGKLTAYVSLTDKEDNTADYMPFGLPEIEIGIDPVRKAEAGYLQGMVMDAYFTVLQQQMTDPVQMKEWVDLGLREIDSAENMSTQEKTTLRDFLTSLNRFTAMTDTSSTMTMTMAEGSPFSKPDIKVVAVHLTVDKPHSSFEITFPQGLLWGLIGVTLAFALSIVQERTGGTYLRLRIAPVTRAQILAGKGLAGFISCIAVCIILLAIGRLIFDVRLLNIPMLAVTIVCCGICFSGIVMLISVIGRTEQAVAGAGWAIMLIQAMIGGGMIPLLAMPSWMLTISNFSTVKWSIYALEGAIWRGFSPADMVLPLGILLGVGIAAYSIGVGVLVKTDR